MGTGWDLKISRRDLLKNSSIGFGATALAALLAKQGHGATSALQPISPHFSPKAKRVIFLFMHGGPSQVDTFDYKPLLQRDTGKPLPFSKPRVVSAETGNLLASPFRFKQYGQTGTWVSEIFPNIGQCADDLCFIYSMHGSNSRHGGALLELHTGSDTFIRPSMGSWVTYGLGTENQNLPGFITICPTLTHGGVNNWSSAFLPAIHQGTPVGTSSIASDKAKIPFIQPFQPGNFQRHELHLLEEMNKEHLTKAGSDPALEGRIQAMELAFRMQSTAPELQDISKESKETLELYGLNDSRTANFGRMCLMARRFAERGVRFIQVTHSYKWDQHSNLKTDHDRNAREVDKPIAGLLKDLKRLGLLEDTLVFFAGEFGRTPVAQGGDGRDHNPHAFTIWLAGGGVKAGCRHGSTDDYGYFAVENRVHFHDLHATILHLLGLNHKKLTFPYGGRDFRLTDVEGEVVREILA